MAKKIITISREFGSGGRYLGESIAKKLGIKYYDKDIMQKVVEESGLGEEFVANSSELSPRKGFFAYAFIGRDATGHSMEDYLYAAQRKVILDIAEKESCVIIGRNADVLLQDRDDVLNVYISGNMPEKIKRITSLYNVSEKEAKKLLHDIDKRRAINYNYYTEGKWGLASNYDLCLNSSTLGYEKCEDIIIQCFNN